MIKTTALPLLLCGMALAGPAHALDIDDSSAALNDRFANDPSFIMDDYDLSGVGRAVGGRWGTLVSENVFVSAFHYGPGVGAMLTFHESNAPASSSITREVIAAQQVGTSDIWIGVLDTPAPVGYTAYDFATENIVTDVDFLGSIYYDKNAFLIGQSPNSYIISQDIAAGRNVLDGWEASVTAPGVNAPAITSDIEIEALDVTYEAALVDGDSGAPLFVDIDGDNTLRLVGTNWYIEGVGGVTTLNGFTYLGNYSTQIQNYIDANAVPEPSGIAVLAIGGLVFLRRRRR